MLQKNIWFVATILVIAILGFAAVAGAQTPAQKQSALEILASAAMPNKTLIEAPTACAGEAGLLIKEIRDFCSHQADNETKRSIAAVRAVAQALAPEKPPSAGVLLLQQMALQIAVRNNHNSGYFLYDNSVYVSPNPYFRRW